MMFTGLEFALADQGSGAGWYGRWQTFVRGGVSVTVIRNDPRIVIVRVLGREVACGCGPDAVDEAAVGTRDFLNAMLAGLRDE